ncbi:hypothetical protein [Paludisphaera mucosa]|uniref:PEP-CTERM protein-sorting domain-containing protein n=1 Tax=Paludisphaera mucosa TaxID=3030827 RepID=A0ABT6FIH7_9BACT|nr:hypothetical protein [Paludisphaera mucosa]MDG3007339.1 hypothetical protein [Paludisphaera mucosa]
MNRKSLCILGILCCWTDAADAGFATNPWEMRISSQYTNDRGAHVLGSLGGRTPLTLPETTFTSSPGTATAVAEASTDYVGSAHAAGALLDGSLSVGGYDPQATNYSWSTLSITSSIRVTLGPPSGPAEDSSSIGFDSFYHLKGVVAEGDVLMFSVSSSAQTTSSGGGIVGLYSYFPTSTWQTVTQPGDFDFIFSDDKILGETYGYWYRNFNYSRTWTIQASVSVLIYHYNGAGITSIDIDPGVMIRNASVVPEPGSFGLSIVGSGCLALGCFFQLRGSRDVATDTR